MVACYFHEGEAGVTLKNEPFLAGPFCGQIFWVLRIGFTVGGFMVWGFGTHMPCVADLAEEPSHFDYEMRIEQTVILKVALTSW